MVRCVFVVLQYTLLLVAVLVAQVVVSILMAVCRDQVIYHTHCITVVRSVVRLVLSRSNDVKCRRLRLPT